MTKTSELVEAFNRVRAAIRFENGEVPKTMVIPIATLVDAINPNTNQVSLNSEENVAIRFILPFRCQCHGKMMEGYGPTFEVALLNLDKAISNHCGA
jgi:hypothetical protein